MRVLDATAGLGCDAFVLAALGAEVLMLERSSIVAALLQDGLRRAGPAGGRLNLVVGDARIHLTRESLAYDVIYLDPMFPQRAKTALPRKEMQLLRELLDGQDDSTELLLVALQRAKHVVVKRPPWAAPLGDLEPHHAIESKLARYDVYVGAVNTRRSLR